MTEQFKIEIANKLLALVFKEYPKFETQDQFMRLGSLMKENESLFVPVKKQYKNKASLLKTVFECYNKITKDEV